MKQKIRLNESQLQRVIAETVKSILRESEGQSVKDSIFSVIMNNLTKMFGQDSIDTNDDDTITVAINDNEYVSINLNFGCYH